MTVATGYFENGGSSGTGGLWQDVSELDSTYSTRRAYCAYSGGLSDLVLMNIDVLADLPNGTQFNSLQVDFKHKVDNAVGTWYLQLKGYVAGVYVTGTEFETGATGVLTVSESFSGDATYWGITGSAKDILIALRDGTLELYFDANTTAGSGDIAYISYVDVTVDYTEVDTKRAALASCVP